MAVVVASAACAAPHDSGGGITDQQVTTPSLCDYPQTFGTPQHTGLACTEVKGMRVVKTITQDIDADAENAASGFLQIHEPAPLTSGDYVVVPSKSGFTTRADRTTESYRVQVFRWLPSVVAPDAQLVPVWTGESSWQPLDAVVGSLGVFTGGYVQQFSAAIANESVYVPASNGRLLRYSLKSGGLLATINPLEGTPFDGDRQTIVNNAISVDSSGSLYYTVTAFPSRFGDQPRGSWLVKVTSNDVVRTATWASIATSAIGVPQRADLCEWPFETAGTPPATGPTSRPPMFACGTQRPALNAPVAISADGRTLVAFSYANNQQSAAFLISVDAATLAPVRAYDTRGHLRYGCGVRLDVATYPGCDVITAGGTVNIGNDPEFNGPVRFRGEDLMDSAPVIAPNGDLLIGSYDGGFAFEGPGGYDARSSGLVFASDGKLRAKNETFWWEVTPSVWQRPDGSFSYLQDRQLYSDFELTVASYSPTMVLESAGTVPLDFSANAIDFLDAHIVFGPGGDHYALNGMGRLYKFDAAGHAVDSVELTNPDGTVRSMETESNYFARDRAGRIYVSYAGYVYVVASSDRAEQPPTLTAPSAHLLAGVQAKRAGMAKAALPPVN